MPPWFETLSLSLCVCMCVCVCICLSLSLSLGGRGVLRFRPALFPSVLITHPYHSVIARAGVLVVRVAVSLHMKPHKRTHLRSHPAISSLREPACMRVPVCPYMLTRTRCPHMRTHTRCPLIRTHIRTHIRSHPTMCSLREPVCLMRVVVSSYLKAHIRTHIKAHI